MQFRKKPVVIDAWEISLDAERPAWVQEAFASEALDWDPAGEGLWVNTLEGALVGIDGRHADPRRQGRAVPLQARHLRGHL